MSTKIPPNLYIFEAIVLLHSAVVESRSWV